MKFYLYLNRLVFVMVPSNIWRQLMHSLLVYTEALDSLALWLGPWNSTSTRRVRVPPMTRSFQLCIITLSWLSWHRKLPQLDTVFILRALKTFNRFQKVCKTVLAELSPITITHLFNYTENFSTKKWKFSDKNSDIFHISAQNIDCGYSLEPPRRSMF